MLKQKKFWKRVFIWLLIIPIVLLSLMITIVYVKQQEIVQHFIVTANKDFKGKVEISNSHIAPFANFPYISVDLEDFEVYETKSAKEPIIRLNDLYLGFDFWTLVSGNFDISMIRLDDGFVHIYQDSAGEYNILKAFEAIEPIEDVEEEFHFSLDEINMNNVYVDKMNADSLKIEGILKSGEIGLSNEAEHLFMDLDLTSELSIIDRGDTSFLNNKPIVLKTKVDFNKQNEFIQLSESAVEIMNSSFNLEGALDVKDNFDLDLKIKGQKSDFSLLIALAPDDLIPLLSSFENRGEVFFEAQVKGAVGNGNFPKITADFGCENGFFKNNRTDKSIESLQFKGHFENEQNKGIESMKFYLSDFQASPSTGVFKADLNVFNFASPEIELKLNTNFELDYLAQFFNVEQLENLSGKVNLEMNFHDIIDLDNPEKSIEKLNESYYTELHVSNLRFKIPGYAESFENINIDAHMDGHKAILDKFHVDVGHSSIDIEGTISDLPALLHHTAIPVESNLKIWSDEINITELTSAKGDKVVNEVIKDMKLNLVFKSSAKDLTESPYLPIGEFFIKDFHADLSTYPHEFHDFHADILIDTNDLSIVDFSGMLDSTDFHFTGKVETYPMWFQERIEGDTKVEYDFTSKHFALKDIFSYQGENHVPEDYRNEEISNTKIHGHANLHFKDHQLISTDVWLTELAGKLKMHPLRFKDFSGRMHIEGEQLTLEKFGGSIGKSSFKTDLSYYFGSQSGKKENVLDFNSPYLDFNTLFSYESPTASDTETVEHDSVFSIFDIPFPNMRFHMDIGQMTYHSYRLTNINADLRTTKEHLLHLDTLNMNIAGGKINISGLFNGSDRSNIQFSPLMHLDKVDLDQLMVKFDNFGQDEIVSDNLHGIISGKLWGDIQLHADLVPMIDQSELHMDFNISNGALEEYAPLMALSGYFEDEALHKVIFDTLKNHVDIKNGEMTIPEMVINSNLGFLKVSGKQDMEYNMEYYISVPWKMVAKAGRKKLFGGKEVDPASIGEYDPDKNYRFVNLVITGDAEDYSVKMGKKK